MDILKRHKLLIGLSAAAGVVLAVSTATGTTAKAIKEAKKLFGVKLPSDLSKVWDRLRQQSRDWASKFGKTQADVEKQLVKIDFMGNKIKVHKLVADKFMAVDKNLRSAKIPYRFYDVQTINWRYSRPTEARILKEGDKAKDLNVGGHAFGFSVDINPNDNPQRNLLKEPKKTDIPIAVVSAFKNNGFKWGGDFPAAQYDPMHFEIKNV